MPEPEHLLTSDDDDFVSEQLGMPDHLERISEDDGSVWKHLVTSDHLNDTSNDGDNVSDQLGMPDHLNDTSSKSSSGSSDTCTSTNSVDPPPGPFYGRSDDGYDGDNEGE